MATIEIRRPHHLPLPEARRRAEQLARRIEQRLSVLWRWQSDDLLELTAPPGPASGARGQVRLTPEQVHIDVDLPFALRPVRRMLEGKLNDKLDALLGPA